VSSEGNNKVAVELTCAGPRAGEGFFSTGPGMLGRRTHVIACFLIMTGKTDGRIKLAQLTIQLAKGLSISISMDVVSWVVLQFRFSNRRSIRSRHKCTKVVWTGGRERCTGYQICLSSKGHGRVLKRNLTF
jgi:hypothetical protein